MGLKGTGWQTVGLKAADLASSGSEGSRPGRQWDWKAADLADSGTGRQQTWQAVGLEGSRPGRQWDWKAADLTGSRTERQQTWQAVGGRCMQMA